MPFADGRVRSRLRGVAVGLLTSFDDDLEIRHDRLKVNTGLFSGGGISSFLATANINKCHSLPQQERVDVTETVVDALPDSTCALTGVGKSTKAAMDLMEAYDHVGMDAMMVIPPDHIYVHERRLTHYYRKLDVATDTPPVPYICGFDPSISFLRNLSRIEGVVGVRYTIEDPVKLGSAVTVVDDDMVWVNDPAKPYAVSFRNEGIEGLSVGAGNFRPEIGLALFEALIEENWERAREVRDLTLPFQALHGGTGTDNDLPGVVSIPIVKKGLELTGLHDGEVRKPIRPLSADDERRTEELYEGLDDGIAHVID